MDSDVRRNCLKQLFPVPAAVTLRHWLYEGGTYGGQESSSEEGGKEGSEEGSGQEEEVTGRADRRVPSFSGGTAGEACRW